MMEADIRFSKFARAIAATESSREAEGSGPPGLKVRRWRPRAVYCSSPLCR